MALFGRAPSLEEALAVLRRRLDEKGPVPREVAALGREIAQHEGPPASGDPSLPEMVAAIPDAAAVVDGGLRFVAANRPFMELIGGTVQGRTIVEATRSAELADVALHAVAGWPAQREMTLPGPGKVVDALVAPLSQARALVVLRDLTEQKRQEAVRRDFIASASHELRTPVSAISGAVETLLSGLPLDPQARPFVEMIARHAERLGGLTRDLLDLSRLEAGDFHLALEPLEVKALGQDAFDLLQAKAAAKQISLELRVPEEIRVLADPRALEQILVNLLDNAVKYTPARGRVTLTAAQEGPSVVLSVSDTGVGIEAIHQKRIFERFYRVDQGRSREAGGTGLGLAIVKHLTAGLGGEVGLESGSGGSRFWVRLQGA